MDFKIEKFASARAVEVLRTAGLHKLAGAMAGVDEITLKEAVVLIGAKAYMQRRENQKIAEGLVALADLNGEKIADSILAQLAGKAMPHALGGAAIGAIPTMMQDGPVDQNKVMLNALLGGGLGLVGGMGGALHHATQDPGMNQQLSQALQQR